MADPCEVCERLAEDETLELALRGPELSAFVVRRLCEISSSLVDISEASGGGEAPSSSTANNSLVAVTTSSTAVLAANADRLGGWVKNISDTPIYVVLAATATALLPTLIDPGQTLVIPEIYVGPISAIHAGTGSKSLEVVEFE